MLHYGLPLTVATIVLGVVPQLIALAMSFYSVKGDYAAGNPSGWMMGNYFAALNFAVLLTFVSGPIAIALFPVFSKLNPESEPKLVQTVFASSIKYTALLLVPATLLLVTLANPLVNTLFPKEGIMNSFFVIGAAPKFPYAPEFLALSVLVNLFVLIGNISLSTFQTGIGETNQVMKQSLLSLGIGLPIAIGLVFFSYSLGGSNGEEAAFLTVVGGIIGALIASMPGMIWGLVWIWKNYRVKADLHLSAKILASSLLATATAFLIVSYLYLPYWMILVAGFVAFSLVYLTCAPLLGAVNSMDIENFRTMFSGLGIVSKVLNMPLLFMHKLCKGNSKKAT